MGKSHKSSGLDQLGPKHANYGRGLALGRPTTHGMHSISAIQHASVRQRQVKITLAWKPLRWQDIKTKEDEVELELYPHFYCYPIYTEDDDA